MKSGAANERVVVGHPIRDSILEEVGARSNGDGRLDRARVDGIVIAIMTVQSGSAWRSVRRGQLGEATAVKTYRP